jgi:hypothetical protein
LAEIIVTPADAEIGGSVWRTAVTVTVNGLGAGGIVVGAVYVAVSGVGERMVPTGEPLPGGPVTSQVMPALEFCTPAENCNVFPLITFAVVGEIVRLTGGATIVSVVLPDTDVFVTRRAVIVTTGGFGIVAGAV